MKYIYKIIFQTQLKKMKKNYQMKKKDIMNILQLYIDQIDKELFNCN